MAEKSLKISLDLDDKAFTSAVKRMQEQLKAIQSGPALIQQQQQISQKMQAMGMGPLAGAGTEQQQQQAQQKAKQLTEETFKKTIANFGAIKKEQAELNKEIAKGIANDERKLKIQERLRELQKDELRTTGELKTLAAQGKGGPGEALSSIGPSLFKGITALAAIASSASSVMGNLMRRPVETAAASGSAMQGTFGKELSSVYSNQQSLEMAFLPEKNKAAQIATESMKGAVLRDWTKAISSVVLQGLGGMTAGGLLGNVPGAVIGLIGGVGHALSDKDTYNTLSFSSGANQATSARRALEFTSNYNTALEGLKNQNPLKRMAAEEYNQNAIRNLEFQRSLGLDYGSFHGAGGFRERTANAGFTDEMAMRMSGQIMQAGGSTRMGKESTLALQAARGFDVTNAGGILGGLSQTLGSAESSKQAFIKMLAEGNKLGLDSSEYREENRKFLDATTQVISRSETTGQGDIQNIIRRFSGFVGEPTNRGIQAAQGAFGAFNQITSSNTGPSGVMRAAGFLQDEVIGAMSPMDRAKLSTIPADQLTTDHPVIQDLARRYGKSPDDLVRRVQKSGAGAIHRLGKGDTLTKSLIEKREAMSKTTSPMMKERLGAEIGAQEQELAGIVSLEYPEIAKNRKQLEAFVKGTTQPGGPGKMGAFDDITKKLEEKETGRPEDETVRGMAESSKLMLQNFREFKDQIVPTAEAIAKFNTRLKETVDIVMKLPEEQRSGVLQQLYNNLTGKGDQSSNQSQAGK